MGNRSSSSGGGGEGGGDDGSHEEQLSYFQMMRVGYAELVNAIIRPPRAEYEIAHLGPKAFDFCSRKFRRRDFEVTNPRGQKLQCSHWEPDEYPTDGALPCIVYMHGNSSARVEALPVLSLCLSLGITVVALDFAGSGLSEGEYVSLGYYERDDLLVIVDHLRQSGKVSTIALWGRSMGAATALMHGERDPSIAAMILDSPFSDLVQLADEMVEKGKEHGVTVPKFVTRLAIRMIKSSVQHRAGFNISHLSPVSHAPRCFIPALFIAGRNDDFISPEHSQRIMEHYGGDKNLIVVEGDHNSIRPRFMYDSVSIFLQQTIQLCEEYVLPGAANMIGLPPWIGIADGQFYYEDDEEGLQEYWNEYLSDEPGGSPPGRRRRLGAGGLNREDGVIGDEDEASYAQMDVGMTQARQAGLQNAIYQMLGATPSGGGAGGGEQRESFTSTSSRSNGGGDRSSSSAASHHHRRRSSRREPRRATSTVENDDSIEWTCELCTLVNHGKHRCDACGNARPHHRHHHPPASSSSPSSSASHEKQLNGGSSGEHYSHQHRHHHSSCSSGGGSSLNAASSPIAAVHENGGSHYHQQHHSSSAGSPPPEGKDSKEGDSSGGKKEYPKDPVIGGKGGRGGGGDDVKAEAKP